MKSDDQLEENIRHMTRYLDQTARRGDPNRGEGDKDRTVLARGCFIEVFRQSIFRNADGFRAFFFQ